jgi:hypothetical protein
VENRSASFRTTAVALRKTENFGADAFIVLTADGRAQFGD